MKTLISPGVLLFNFIKVKQADNSNYLSTTDNNDVNSIHEVGIFSHYRDAKVALEELEEAGFSLREITLVARDCCRYRWLPDLNVCDRFDEEYFGFNQTARRFFQRLFKRGKYILLVTGEENKVKSAGAIMGRRPGHAKVWHF